MKNFWGFKSLNILVRSLYKSFLAAVVFYTIIPIPFSITLNFHFIARWAPAIGLLLGGLLSIFDWTLSCLSMPLSIRSVLIVAIWIYLTGGLHLDGAIDTADGLAIADKSKRLDVMKDSVAGAFGIMAGATIVLLKTIALSEINNYRWLVLMSVMGWGRWGQVVAIALYPYLRTSGKGLFHKTNIHPAIDISFGSILLLGLSCLLLPNWQVAISLSILGCTLACLVGWWFNKQLGGHTGDTYGAVVEWTEALFISFCTCWFS
jgi:adenosylcobinamide-GDP ribazoletransferase